MERKLSIKKLMPPTWMQCPELSQYSMGWRMGYGEDYAYKFSKWFETLSEEDQKEYHKLFPKPSFWNDEMYYPEIQDDYFFPDFWSKDGKPKYNRNNLEGFNEKGFVFFWKPEKDTINKSCFSQWQESAFYANGLMEYLCAEQYMMAEKARLFKDKTIEEEIMKSKDPFEMKSLGQKVRNFNPKIWDMAKYAIVLNGNYFKFTQNEAMRNFLLLTDDKILVEASPKDKIWGIGLSEDEENAMNPYTWRGENLLGFALMEVREELKKLYKNYYLIDWKLNDRN